MSNLERHPSEVLECSSDGSGSSGDFDADGASGATGANASGTNASGSNASARIEILAPREVPLGGPRAMTVRRTLPSKQRTMIGAWCFLDHYGPEDVSVTGGMRVPPHPHTGLQTVSWLFEGEIEHRDSVGSHAFVRPGELNLMTAGRGISHSEVSTAATTVLHGAQLWVALPDDERHRLPSFESHVSKRVQVGGALVQVFMGELAGVRSEAMTFSPLVAAQIDVAAGASVDLPLNAGFEHGLLVDAGGVTIDVGTGYGAADEGVTIDGGAASTTRVEPHELAVVCSGCRSLRLTAGTDPARLLLIGGEPLGEQLLMWWNFVGRSHDEIVAYRAAWQAQQIGVGAGAPAGTEDLFAYGVVGATVDNEGAPLPAPELPMVRLKPRR